MSDHARACVMPTHDQPRRAHGELLLCAGHHHALVDLFTAAGPDRVTLAELYDELATVLAGLTTTAGGAPVTGSSEARLPLNEHVADVRVGIRHTLASWARVHAEELRATPPADDEPTTVGPWLARYTDWAAAQQWIDDYLGELLALRGRAWSAYDLTRIRSAFDVGPCYLPDLAGAPCVGEIRVVIREQQDETLETTVACTVDPDHVWTAEQWTRLGRHLSRAA